MRILILSDIHANLDALEAVLSAAGNVDETWCLGDLVGYGPDPNEVVDRIRNIPNLHSILGNHDAAVVNRIRVDTFNNEASQSIKWIQNVLDPQNLSYLENLPEKLIFHDVTIAHGSPRNPVWEYILDTYTANDNFNYFNTSLCFVGHTHLPVIYQKNNRSSNVQWELIQSQNPIHLKPRAILNPGSVGQPRDHDPRASFAIFIPEENIWEPKRVSYDYTVVQKRIIEAGLPFRNALRLEAGW